MIGKRIAQLLQEKDKTQADLARAIGVTPQAVGHWVAGDSDPVGRRRRAIAEYLGVTEADLLFGAGQEQMNRVPLVKWSTARRGKEGEVESTVLTSVSVGEKTFATKVAGDSMTNPAGWPSFPEGTTIVVEPESEPEPGDYVLALVGGQLSFKRLARDSGRTFLRPLNPAYPTVEMSDGDTILGVVLEFSGRLK